eukprot:6064157-Ditylum_brightwellii.AAC.1
MAWALLCLMLLCLSSVFADPTHSVVTLCYSRGSNLLMAHLEHEGDQRHAYPGTAVESEVDNQNIGLMQNEKVMRWHYCLDHYFLKWIQFLMRVGKDGEPPVIPTQTNRCANCCDKAGLLCVSCQAG